ncbi:MAG: hypothetical protein K0R66_1184 [Gammaproteobacteria bacterium]|jgi:pimeloyl-ACP methyl ester carboxylesterase|nr:hypothetical protein [Gammaproteobacteria bacterium]
MPLIQLDKQNISSHYELHGNQKNKTLVLINGLTRDHTAWKRILPFLIEEYCVLVFDNRGVGQTKDAGKAFTVETMADDTIALIEALQLQKPYIVGHSLGGAIAQTIAYKYSDKIQKIALCNTFIKINKEAMHAFENTLAIHQSGASQSEIVDSLIPWVFSKSFVTPEVRAMIHKLSNENPYPQSSTDYQRQLKALNEFDSGKWVSSIRLPSLVIGSEEDITATPQESEELASKITGARLTLIPGAHACYTEQPIKLAETLKSFFQ